MDDVPDIDRNFSDSESPLPSPDDSVSDKNSSSTLLQIINEQKKFSSELLGYMKYQWNIADKGFDYHVLAVFGSQSTGKSTLLNKLFETQFDMMNEIQRKQTTKGIWMSRTQKSNILVMDVEGTDGRERGEDQDFERKSALFSLATTEVLLINMWETQVGLYNGANMGLLKTVFDVNLELFQKSGSPKTLLLFVIRDFTGMTPIQNLSETIIIDLNKIWDTLKKPEGKESCKINDYFDFKYIGLPHKHFAQKQFEDGVTKLRKWFIDPKSENYLFKPQYHKHIPADGFPRFAETIWDKIVSNKDLDLPTQQQLLAQYRCDEILRAEFEIFMETIKPYKPRLETGRVIEKLGSEMSSISDKILENFDKDASRYHSDVYNSKRQELIKLIHTNLLVFYNQQLRNLHKHGLASFKLKILNINDEHFATTVNICKDEATNYFRNGAYDAKLSDTDWNSEEYYIQFVEEIDSLISKKRVEIMEVVVKKIL
ncbi:Dynamin-like GTPase that mediates homotypic ER fusion, partial [Nowakowskiella sp. JEL0078]